MAVVTTVPDYPEFLDLLSPLQCISNSNRRRNQRPPRIANWWDMSVSLAVTVDLMQKLVLKSDSESECSREADESDLGSDESVREEEDEEEEEGVVPLSMEPPKPRIR